MPSLANHPAANIVKVLVVGDSGCGKTGALFSLLEAGYRLHILDFDNGLDILVKLAMAKNPDLLKQVNYVACQDQLKTRPGDGAVITKGSPTAFNNAMKALDKWPVEEGEEPYAIYDLGPKDVVVGDSLTHMGKAAMRWAVAMNPTCKDPRQWYQVAQEKLEAALAYLYSDAVKCNIIMNTHIDIREMENVPTKGYPKAIGKALGPTIPTYFNHMLQVKSIGSGKSLKRVVSSVPNGLIDLKSTVEMNDVPIQTALATFFKLVKGE